MGRALENGDVYLEANGLYWLSHDSSAVEKLTIYPTPTEAGLTIEALCVVAPTELDDDNTELVVPPRFAQAVVDYAAAYTYGAEEDNPELRSFHEQRFEDRVAELFALRNSRVRRGVVQMQVEGYHF
jgi:hypothetical protein